ncbi:hypothetical protein LLB_2102 [Legionella longbeachae D-4968]|nr:hypothetical protein LLB_2102 [Legionella longbeachae D-4968]
MIFSPQGQYGATVMLADSNKRVDTKLHKARIVALIEEQN